MHCQPPSTTEKHKTPGDEEPLLQPGVLPGPQKSDAEVPREWRKEPQWEGERGEAGPYCSYCALMGQEVGSSETQS